MFSNLATLHLIAHFMTEAFLWNSARLIIAADLFPLCPNRQQLHSQRLSTMVHY